MSIASVADLILVSPVLGSRPHGHPDDESPADGTSQADPHHRGKSHHHPAEADQPSEAEPDAPDSEASDSGAPPFHPSALLDISA